MIVKGVLNFDQNSTDKLYGVRVYPYYLAFFVIIIKILK